MLCNSFNFLHIGKNSAFQYFYCELFLIYMEQKFVSLIDQILLDMGQFKHINKTCNERHTLNVRRRGYILGVVLLVIAYPQEHQLCLKSNLLLLRSDWCSKLILVQKYIPWLTGYGQKMHAHTTYLSQCCSSLGLSSCCVNLNL